MFPKFSFELRPILLLLQVEKLHSIIFHLIRVQSSEFAFILLLSKQTRYSSKMPDTYL